MDGDEIGECKWCQDIRLFHPVELNPLPVLTPKDRATITTFGTRPAAAQRRALSTPVNEQDYQDEGCEVAPSCLACPLPACKYDTSRLRHLAR